MVPGNESDHISAIKHSLPSLKSSRINTDISIQCSQQKLL